MNHLETDFARNKVTQSYHFVGGIGTIGIAIAAPFLGDAITISASKIIFFVTLVFRTFPFITSVAAIVFTVTKPFLLNAVAVVTGELVGSASLIWKWYKNLRKSM